MNTDTLYWIFSTISQTLAALIAVVGVVVIFRIDQMSRGVTRLIDKNLDSLIKTKDRGALRTEAEALVKFQKHYDENESKDINGHDDLATEGKVVRHWRLAEKQFIDIKRNLRWFFILSLITLALSLSAMPFAKCIAECKTVSIVLVASVIIGSMLTGVFMAISFFSVLGKFLVDYKGEYIKREMIK